MGNSPSSQQKPRYEFKYIVGADVAQALQERLGDAMQVDPHATGGGYRVNSVYYDTPDLRAYFEKLDGVSRRYKIRLRYYGEVGKAGDLAGLTAFLEAKYRINQTTAKDRVRLPGHRVADLIEDTRLSVDPDDCVLEGDRESMSILNSLTLREPLQPFCTVTYHRRPFVCRISPTLRVTFDTDLRVRGPAGLLQPFPEHGQLFLPRDSCVVEVKFHWAMPLWLLEICRECGLKLRRYSKYCSAMERRHPSLARRSVRIEAIGTSAAAKPKVFPMTAPG